MLRKDRDDGKAGVALLIKNGIMYTELEISSTIPNFAFICATISIGRTKINLCSIYNHHRNSISQRGWETFFQSLPHPCIVTGDWNVHSELVGSSYTDGKGSNLMNAAAESNFCFINDGSPTLIPAINQRISSAIDITFVSNSLATRTTWHLLNDSLGSNHWPSVITLVGTEVNLPPSTPTRRWKVHEADWERFSKALEDRERYVQENLTYNNFINALRSACDDAIPKYEIALRGNRRLHWWNHDCSNAIAHRKQMLLNYKQSPNINTYIAMKRAVDEAKNIITAAKRSSWGRFCDRLVKTTPIKEIWNQIRKIKHAQSPVNGLQKGGWVQDFLQKLTPDWVTGPTEPHQEDGNDETLTAPFTLCELQSVLKRNSNSSPGIDQITYQILHRLPANYQRILLRLFNEFWRSGNFPEDWSNYIVIPILKQGKPNNNANSYRPISLASCLMKIFERLVKCRLQWWVENKGLLPDSQFGFRHNRSTIDAINTLLTDVQNGLTCNRSTTAIFLDISSAYDDVDWHLLCSKLVTLGIPNIVVRNIRNLLSTRNIFIRTNGELYGPRRTSKGLAQGAILSTVLYALYVAGLDDILPEEVSIIQYADDICIYSIDSDFEICRSRLDVAVGRAVEFFAELGLNISPSKSMVCPFTRRRNVPFGDTITLGNITFPCVRKVRFLGLNLTAKLSWNLHVRMTVQKTELYSNILRSFTSTSWGADTTIA